MDGPCPGTRDVVTQRNAACQSRVVQCVAGGADPVRVDQRIGRPEANRGVRRAVLAEGRSAARRLAHCGLGAWRDRKSTRLNSSHANISYAVFCLKKKKHIKTN